MRCLLTDVPLTKTDLKLLTEEFTACREDSIVFPTTGSPFFQQVLLGKSLYVQIPKIALERTHMIQERVIWCISVHHVQDASQEPNIIMSKPTALELVIRDGYTTRLDW
ncbi:hypothetical protein C498_10381 [Haloferax volcanii DS2]|uniref:Uncharacterized protein n=1 Tax=Haloferax volcanii (strain ATCC 29605 / DSM 3757 / JCM 8879 / NBRC 14742 / NCIMB 2012 / VKM B-1768 / DS2) TaxID=309800 RepID=L9V1X1_HALVD|nr:hypothetical protein C498_10381 [Haloferax volcanii DS2]